MERKTPLVNGRTIFGLLLVIAAFACNGKNDRHKDYTSIAVLPFDNLNKSPELGYFSDGLAEDIRNDLSRTKGLKVCARASAFQFRGGVANIPEVGGKLKAGTLLEGSLRIEADHITVNVSLFDVSDGARIWSGRFSENMENVSALQEKITAEVVRQLHLAPAEKTAATATKRSPGNQAAYSMYLKGRVCWNLRTPADLKKGIELFTQALALDSTYAAAWSGIADCYTALGYGSFVAPRDAFPKALDAAKKALFFDSTLAEPHASLGYYKFYYEWDWAAAEQEFRASIARNANYEIAYDWYGYYLTAMRRFDEARIVLQKAIELDPLSVPIHTDLGFSAFYAGNYDTAIVELKGALQMNPKYPLGHLWMGRAYHGKKMYRDAIAEYEKGIPGWPVTIALVGNAFGEWGYKDSARQMLDTLNAWYPKKFVTAYGVASVYAGLGEKDETFEWLNKAVDERSNWLVWLRLDPRWAGIRSDRRYAEIMGKLGLPE